MRRIASLVVLCLVTLGGAWRGAKAQSGAGTGLDLMDVDLMFIGAHPGLRHSARLPVTVKASAGPISSEDAAEVYLLPSLVAPRLDKAPKIDGDLADLQSLAHGEIGPNDVWSRRPAKDLYDGDDKDAGVGANISETGLAWAAFEWGGKQALPYLWPRVVLGR